MFTNHILWQFAHKILSDYIRTMVHPDGIAGETPGVYLKDPLLTVQPGKPLAYMAIITAGSRVSFLYI